jgi:hypothetical protein
MGLPQAGELFACVEEFGYQLGHLWIVGVAGGGGAQALRRHAGERVRVRDSVQPLPLRVRAKKDTAHKIAVASRQGGEVLHQGCRQIVPGEYLEGRGRYGCRGLRQSVQQNAPDDMAGMPSLWHHLVYAA